MLLAVNLQSNQVKRTTKNPLMNLLFKSWIRCYSRTPLFRTWLIRSPRYFEGRSNSLGFTLMFSVIYYQLFRTRLLRIPRYFELIVLSLHLKSNLSKTEYVHKSTAGNVLHFIWARTVLPAEIVMYELCCLYSVPNLIVIWFDCSTAGKQVWFRRRARVEPNSGFTDRPRNNSPPNSPWERNLVKIH